MILHIFHFSLELKETLSVVSVIRALWNLVGVAKH